MPHARVSARGLVPWRLGERVFRFDCLVSLGTIGRGCRLFSSSAFAWCGCTRGENREQDVDGGGERTSWLVKAVKFWRPFVFLAVKLLSRAFSEVSHSLESASISLRPRPPSHSSPVLQIFWESHPGEPRVKENLRVFPHAQPKAPQVVEEFHPCVKRLIREGFSPAFLKLM